MVDQKYKRIYAMTPKTYRIITARKNWLMAAKFNSIEEASQSMISNDAYILEAWPAERIVAPLYREEDNG